MPKPWDSMYSESIYSQSSWAPSITPSLLNAFPVPPIKEENVIPAPAPSTSKLPSIAEERRRNDRAIRRDGLLAVPTATSIAQRPRSASFSGLTETESKALTQVPTNRAQPSPVQFIPKTCSRGGIPSTAMQYSSEGVVLQGVMRRQMRTISHSDGPVKLTKPRPILPRSMRGERSRTVSNASPETTSTPSTRTRQVSQPFMIRSGNKTPVTIMGSHLRPSNLKYATTQERMRGISHTRSSFDQHNVLRTRQKNSGTSLPLNGNDALERFMREKSLVLEIQKAKTLRRISSVPTLAKEADTESSERFHGLKAAIRWIRNLKTKLPTLRSQSGAKTKPKPKT